MNAADTVFVSPVTFFEIALKVRIGKWPEMERFAGDLPGILRAQGGAVADFTPSLCVMAGMMGWAHRNPFDRLLAATALLGKLGLFRRIVSSTRLWRGFGKTARGRKSYRRSILVRCNMPGLCLGCPNAGQ